MFKVFLSFGFKRLLSVLRTHDVSPYIFTMDIYRALPLNVHACLHMSWFLDRQPICLYLCVNGE